jgi:hypothetical protein
LNNMIPWGSARLAANTAEERVGVKLTKGGGKAH